MTWAGELVRAEAALRDAGELLEARQFGEGLEQLAVASAHLADAVRLARGDFAVHVGREALHTKEEHGKAEK